MDKDLFPTHLGFSTKKTKVRSTRENIQRSVKLWVVCTSGNTGQGVTQRTVKTWLLCHLNNRRGHFREATGQREGSSEHLRVTHCGEASLQDGCCGRAAFSRFASRCLPCAVGVALSPVMNHPSQQRMYILLLGKWGGTCVCREREGTWSAVNHKLSAGTRVTAGGT